MSAPLLSAMQTLSSADIGRAQLEAVGRIDTHGVKEPAADEFDAGDEGRRRLDVGLQQRDAFNGRLERPTADIGLERAGVTEQLHAKPLAGAVVLGDHRPVTETRMRGHDLVGGMAGDRVGNRQAGARQRAPCATLLISSATARLPFSTCRPDASSQCSRPVVISGA